MKLRKEDVAKLESFLARIGDDVYPEPPSPVHTDVAEKMVRLVLEKAELTEGSKILDIGCGQGVALKLFVDAGCDAQGIALGEDVQACIDQGYNVREMDQSFLDFPDNSFDLVWSRHCLEHSIMPYFTLSEMSRVLKPGGYCYVEVPTADTSCMHQNNPNHYSVLGRSMWATLLQRSGFKITKQLDISFKVPVGDDMYWAFLCQKKAK